MPTTFIIIFLLISAIGFGIITAALKYFLHIDPNIAILLTSVFQSTFIVWAMLGFSAAIAGVFIGLASQYWLERKDA